MKIKDMPIYVGKRAYDDNRKIGLPGTLIMPESKSDISLIFETGLNGHHQDYIDYFGKLLGNDFNVYINEMRNRGLWMVDQSPDDLAQVDEIIRDITETDKVFYVGHSMGMDIAVETRIRHKNEIKGLYGICAYPSIGFTRSRTSENRKGSWEEKIIDSLPLISFLSYPLKNSMINDPVRFAIAENDEVLNIHGMRNNARRFVEFYSQYPKSTSKIFKGKNHCFNNTKYMFSPFNRDEPEKLVDDIIKFVYCTIL